MKKIVFILIILCISISVQLVAQTEPAEITPRNSWLKAGLNVGVPFGDISDVSSFTAGIDLKGQLMETNHVGIGITTGYNHFFPKNDFDAFGTIPLGVFIRYYPQTTGFFLGTDVGYSFLTGIPDGEGGFYVRPEVGYHNYDWNLFAFYNGIFRGDTDGGAIQYAGIGATYNIRFNRK